MKRGIVVIVDFAFASGAAAKKRPAVVIQNDRAHQRLKHTIVAMVTGNESGRRTCGIEREPLSLALPAG
jgi:mRNA-degrading endonuclease toxin of MazEF toxin-antitoxin module